MAEQRAMGIGRLGFKNLTFKRKFRFTFTITNICNSNKFVPEHYVKVAAKPKWGIEETEINFLNAKDWIPGKQSFETINVSYLDVATIDHKPLFDWLASVYDFTDPINLRMGSHRNDYAGTGILKMWDGCGKLLEMWTMDSMWPTEVDFGDVDYESSELSTIDLTLRYSSIKYENFCPGMTIDPCCTGCN